MSRFHAKLVNRGSLKGVELTRGAEIPQDMYAKWAGGRAAPEAFVHLLRVAPVLFSSRVVDALQKHEVTGWKAKNVRLVGKSGEEIEGYSLLVVVGRCGQVQYERSERVSKSYPAGEFPALKGLYFDESSWDGSDVFMCESGQKSIFVTKRAKDAIETVARKAEFPSLADWEVGEFALRGVPGVNLRSDA